MSVSETFRVEELDDASRAYLQEARERRGRGLPGFFVPKSNPWPILALLLGISVLITTFFIAFPPIHEPLAEAMLQTAGLMLGGWCILAAFRMWGALASGKSVGHFIFADAENLWECSGSTVVVTDLADLDRATGTHHTSKEGNYEKTEITIWLGGRSKTVKVTDQHRAEQLIYFLSVLPGLQYKDADENETPKKRSPAQIGGIASEWARGNDVPSNASLDQLELDVTEIPYPERTGTPSSGLLQCFIILALAVGGVLMFKSLNVPWRDDAIFERIQQIHHEPSRAPWLSAYLADARNTRHRAEAQKMRDRIYDDALARIKMPMGQAVDPELQAAFIDLMKAVRAYNQPILSVGVKGPKNNPKAPQVDEVQNAILAQIERTIGEKLVALVKAPEGVPGLIEVSWDWEDAKEPFGQGKIIWTISFRKKPDDKPVTFERPIPVVGMDRNAQIRDGARTLAQMIAGNMQAPPVPQEDF